MKGLLAKTNRREPIYKRPWWRGVLKSLTIVNLYRIKSILKLKVNFPQLLCSVVSAAQNGECDLMGFALTVTRLNPPNHSLRYCEPQKHRHYSI